jgi:anaerobic selenocysteine-containing dehydrogenase
MAMRTVACLPALVGAWGKPGGGAHVSTGSAYEVDFDALRRPDLLTKPVREINHSTLGRALLDLKDPPIKALFVGSNNPAVTCPDQNRVVASSARTSLLSSTTRFSRTPPASPTWFCRPARRSRPKTSTAATAPTTSSMARR